MKKLILALSAVTALGAAPAFAQTSVGVSIGIHQPGLYGRIDIGDFPGPTVVYPQPVVIHPSRVAVYQRPIYMYVPPEHQRQWARYCSRYSACGQPVYFVRQQWVQDRWDREHHREFERRERHDHGRHLGHDRRDHDRGDDRRDHGRH